MLPGFSLLVLATAVIVIAGCVGETQHVPQRPLGIDATASTIVERSRAAMEGVSSYRWISDIETNPAVTGHPNSIRVEGYRDGSDYAFEATSGLSEHRLKEKFRLIDGDGFRLSSGIWENVEGLQVVGIPRLDGLSEVPVLTTSDFSYNVASSVLYGIVGEGRDGRGLSTSYELAIRHDDLLLVSVISESTLSNGAKQRQTIRFGMYNESFGIDLSVND